MECWNSSQSEVRRSETEVTLSIVCVSRLPGGSWTRQSPNSRRPPTQSGAAGAGPSPVPHGPVRERLRLQPAQHPPATRTVHPLLRPGIAGRPGRAATAGPGHRGSARRHAVLATTCSWHLHSVSQLEAFRISSDSEHLSFEIPALSQTCQRATV